ncbi:tetratricopeptide repeat protein [Caldimonas brevitalea]|uniref:Pilus assembly protein PilF n=1 Tax=Caldimonas brevitalea TaxID=413882 RepID=A0A0G3BHV4_9BURK|nr:tetratricopeptide repeat protein [Caldimonas brevitalea]AKJ29019.1 pilus assembly protein PilF [Caldimonas brevitalea]
MPLTPGAPADRTGVLAHRLLKYRALLCLAFGASSAARRAFDRMLSRWPGDVFALAGRGHLFAATGDRAAALRDLRELTRLHPRSGANHWFNLAFLLEEGGQYDEAETCFRQAVELDPHLDRAWYGLGLVLIRAHRFEEAAVALKRNTELQPMSPYGWYQLARVHLERRRPDEAIQIIRHLKGFEPKVAAQLERETGLAV